MQVKIFGKFVKHKVRLIIDQVGPPYYQLVIGWQDALFVYGSSSLNFQSAFLTPMCNPVDKSTKGMLEYLFSLSLKGKIEKIITQLSHDPLHSQDNQYNTLLEI